MNNGMRAALLAAIALATILLGTCSDTNIIALLTSEVKRANNKFLIVEGVKNPTAQTDVNPGVQMRIDFDRAVDPATITAANVLISGPGTFSLAYSLSTDNKVLYVQPDPYLSDLQDYTLTLTTGVKGALGEELEQPYSWTFKTGTYPAGTVTVTVSQAEVAYTNLLTNELTIKCNLTSYRYRVAHSPTAYSNFSPSDTAGWVSTTGTQFAVLDPTPFTAGDGTKEVYVQFVDFTGSKFSLVRSGSVILDQTPPVPPTVTQTISSVGTYTNTVYINTSWAATGATNATASSSDTGGSGVASYKWTPGTGVTITSDTLATPTIQTTAVDNSYSATVTATDIAGNTSTGTPISIIRDTVAAAAPVFDSTMTPLYTVDGDPRVSTWYWGPGGGGVGVYRITLYQYQPKDLKWLRVYAAAAALTDSIELAGKYLDKLGLRAFTDGDYVLTLQEYDVAGNLSALASGSSTISPPGAGWRMILGRAAPTTIDMPVPADRTKTSPKFEWRPMEKAEFYVVFYMDEKSGIWTHSSKLASTITIYDVALLPGLPYYWYVEASTSETNPNPKLGEPKWWAFKTQK
jgi:hypothetical protein